jgi:hypothetical protein
MCLELSFSLFLKKIFNFFFSVFELFWCTNIKNEFKKIIKNYYNVFLSKKHFEKQFLPHSQTSIDDD